MLIVKKKISKQNGAALLESALLAALIAVTCMLSISQFAYQLTCSYHVIIHQLDTAPGVVIGDGQQCGDYNYISSTLGEDRDFPG